MGRTNADTYVGTLSVADANRLATDNLRLAWKFIRVEEKRGRVEPVELESLVLLALVRASRTFKPAKGFAFSTWAWLIFKNAVRTHLQLAQCDKRRIVEHQLDWPQDPTSGKAIDLADPTDFVAELSDKQFRRRLLAAGLTALSPREYQVLVWRFVDGLTLDTIGERLGLTRERIRQIEKRALEKCRKRAESARYVDPACGQRLLTPFAVCA